VAITKTIGLECLRALGPYCVKCPEAT